jgi:SAM-dependent methyltransferase
MAGDAQAAAEFYGSPRGIAAARLLRERLALLWPAAKGESVLGLGYAAPYLSLWQAEAARCVALNPGPPGFRPWPETGKNLACAGEDDALPFPDLSFDRILIVHGLEAAEHARRMLREAWRVLKDDGRLLIVAPNRRGLWAQVESTPFGQGQPYSAGQIGRLLAASLFRVERRDTALYFPPSNAPLLLSAANLMERTGRAWVPQIAGVTLAEAVKDVYAVTPIARVAHRRLVLVKAA